ncbi:MAG TPA: DUF2142 domain-containing protein [Candidatus Fournierella merdigallinarum]|nr:DUF2142 domain-containing protein [Candidatus Fournierella merdigallinarum]
MAALGLVAALAGAVGFMYYWRVVYYLDDRGVSALPLYAGAAAFVLLAALAVWAGRALPTFNARAALAIFLCGALFCFADPPLQVPDETAHFLRSYSLSQGRFTFDHDRLYPDDVAKLVESFPGAWVASHTSQGLEYTDEGEERSYTTAGYALKQRGEDGRVESIADGFAAYFDGEPAKEAVGEPYFFMTLSMLPQALGILVARILGFEALGCLYAARLANLLAYTALCWLALENCKRYKPVFTAFMLLPLSLYMAASVSYDATLLGFYYLVASFYCKDEILDKDILVFIAAFLMMNLAKPYISLLWLVLPLVLPRTAWKTRVKKWQLAAGCLVGGLALGKLFDWYGTAFRFNYPYVGRQIEGAAELPQLLAILANPFRYAAVLLGSFYENDFFLGQLGLFGALDLEVPFISFVSPLVLLFAAALSVHEKSSLRPLPAFGLGALSIVYMAGAATAMYITSTPVGMIRIIGLQARYFLPAFLMLFVLVAALLSHVLEPRLASGGAKAQRVALGVSAVFGALGAVLLFQHYFIGPVYVIG